MSIKITPDHRDRQAYVYVRQSTADQLLHNHESRRRQYALTDRARALGWSEVVIVDDDLGRSGGGVERPGFERLLLAICEARVGIVLAVEASRLARNGRDWHTLLEFCGLVGCLLADEDGVYDPRLPNDRLLLGMKGTMSEMELSLLRQRSLEALRQKARRGELFSAPLQLGCDQAVVGIDGVILPPRQPRLVARLGEGEFGLPMDLGIVGRAGIDRMQSGLDPQRCKHSQQFRRYGRVDPQPAKRNAALRSVVEMRAAAMISHAVPGRAAVGDVQSPPAMAAAQQTGQQRGDL